MFRLFFVFIFEELKIRFENILGRYFFYFYFLKKLSLENGKSEKYQFNVFKIFQKKYKPYFQKVDTK